MSILTEKEKEQKLQELKEKLDFLSFEEVQELFYFNFLKEQQDLQFLLKNAKKLSDMRQEIRKSITAQSIYLSNRAEEENKNLNEEFYKRLDLREDFLNCLYYFY
jgi:hypothetical protein